MPTRNGLLPAAALVVTLALGVAPVSAHVSQNAGSSRSATAIGLTVYRDGSQGTFLGSTRGVRYGRVAIQRLTTGGWRTVVHAGLSGARFRVDASIRLGARYRALFPATRTRARSCSDVVRAA